jgi:hypothetical protein
MRRRRALLAVLVSAACGTSPSATPTSLDAAQALQPPTTVKARVVTIDVPTTTVPPVDVAAWQSDLAMLVRNLEVAHPNPYWRVGEAKFREDVASVARRLPAMNTDEATVEIMRLSAEIDGHTQVFVGYLGWEFSRIQFYAFEDGIGVVGATDPSLIGGKLLKVGETPVEEAARRASVLASYDNPMTKVLKTPLFLAVPRLMATLGITDDPERTTFTIERPDGSLVVLAPQTVTFTQYRQLFGDQVIGLPNSNRSLYLQRRDSPFWWTLLDPNTIFFQYNLVMDRGWDPFVSHTILLDDVVTQLDQALDEHPDARLIVDLRHNGGGDNATYDDLLALLHDRYGNRCGLFVLIGRDTFSAAVNFATEVEQQTLATFVGEPTSGSPNLYADLATVELHNSDIKVFISHRYWPIGGPNDHRLWIEPAVSAPPTLDDWNAGRDSALAATLATPSCGPTHGWHSGLLGAD